MMKNDTTHQDVINMMMWDLLEEMNFKKMLYTYSVDEVFDKEYKFIQFI